MLDKLFSFKVEPFLQSRMEHFNDRVRFWQKASEEEWEEGLQGMLSFSFGRCILMDPSTPELKERFDKMLQQVFKFCLRSDTQSHIIIQTQDYMKCALRGWSSGYLLIAT